MPWYMNYFLEWNLIMLWFWTNYVTAPNYLWSSLRPVYDLREERTVHSDSSALVKLFSPHYQKWELMSACKIGIILILLQWSLLISDKHLFCPPPLILIRVFSFLSNWIGLRDYEGKDVLFQEAREKSKLFSLTITQESSLNSQRTRTASLVQ